MKLGERLLNLRKEKHLSQEEVADKLDVTRQTVSKWETDQSVPDFDKIVPICNLYGITSDELLTGVKTEKEEAVEKNENPIKKKALGISLGILLYFLAVALLISLIGLGVNPVLATAIFIFTCGLATIMIIYTCTAYNKKVKVEKKENKVYKQIEEVLGTFALLVYLGVSFVTGAWHITWLIWLIYGLICEAIKLFFMLKGEKVNEEE